MAYADIQELTWDEVDLVSGAATLREVSEAFLVGAGVGGTIGGIAGAAPGAAAGVLIGGAVGVVALFL